MAILIYVVVTLWSLRVLSELAIFTPRLLTLHCWVIYQWCLRHFAELAKFNHLRDILVAARCAQIFKNRGSIASILHHGNSCPTSPGIYIYIYHFQMYHMCTVSTPFFEFYTILYFSNFTSHLFLFSGWFSLELYWLQEIVFRMSSHLFSLQALHERFDRYFKCIAFTGNDLDGDPVIVERSGQLRCRKRLMIS